MAYKLCVLIVLELADISQLHLVDEKTGSRSSWLLWSMLENFNEQDLNPNLLSLKQWYGLLK